MKFSVIIPMYNSSKCIAKCVKSIKEQSHQDFECLLIDDGSSDNTKEICKKAITGDKRFTLTSQENKGVSSARNKGLEKASGDYIVFIDSDDWAEPNLLEELQKAADGQIIQYGYYGIASDKREPKKECGGGFDIKAGTMAVVWRHALPRLKIKDLSFDESLGGGEDYLFLNQALKEIGTIRTLPLCLYNHIFDNKESIMNRTSVDLLKQQIDATKKVQALYDKSNLSCKDKKAFKIRENWCKGEMILYALNLFNNNMSPLKNFCLRLAKKIALTMAR